MKVPGVATGRISPDREGLPTLPTAQKGCGSSMKNDAPTGQPQGAPAQYPHIERALSEGVSAVCFGALQKWTQEELRALIDECGTFHEANCLLIEDWYKEQVFKAENFMSAGRSKRLDDLRKEKFFDSLAKTSEMCAVAMLFLDEPMEVEE